MSRTVYRFRLGAICLGLVALAFHQEPGRIAADTKLDLTVNPVAFLGRALHLWDDSGFFGQVQNQAYGYLWPVGPFFTLLREAGVVPWAAQRIWWAVILVMGFLGFVRLARLLGFQSPLARVLAGLGYVLGVRMVTELAVVSAEAWPMALAPWVLVPLVVGSTRGSPRRWAALSGVAFWLTGGINAVASAAILPLGLVYLLTRSWVRRTWSLTAWWGTAVVLASVWWAIPLLLLGRYSPPFLDWIEGASITTGQNDPTSVLRGASHWAPYLVDAVGPVWLAGWQLVSSPLIVAATAAVTLLGVVGLMSARTPERHFLVLGLCVGLVLTGLGHVSDSGVGGLAAPQVREQLDGVLAPLRNVHKFQPLVTLPLMLGLAHAVTVLQARGRAARLGLSWWATATATGCAAVVALAASPALTGQLVGGRSHLELPGYWREAADWLNAKDEGRALVIPASSFGVYIWGRTQDEPLQALDTQSWAVRDAVPLSSAGNIRFLDEVERYLDAGTGGAGLTAALGRAGVRWLVVRNDLNTRAAQSTLPALLHRALEDSPGISRAATFGPILSAFASGERIVDGGLMRPYPAVEVFRVMADPLTNHGRVALRDATTVVGFTGSAEAVVDLAESTLLGPRPAIAAGDPVPEGSVIHPVATDTFRRAEANFGSAARQYSNTLTDADPYRSSRHVHDYLPVDPDGRQSRARLLGASGVTASSSGSSPFSLRARSPGSQPWAALDGDPRTAWVSGDYAPGVGQWWQVELDTPRLVSSVGVRVVRDVRVGTPPARIRLATDDTAEEFDLRATSQLQVLRLGSPSTTRIVRIELMAVSGGGAGQGFGLAEVSIPRVTVDRPVLTAPSDGGGGIILAARSMGRESCVETDTAIVCDPELAVPGEERAGIDRIVELSRGGSYRVVTRLRPRSGTALDAYLVAPDNAIRVLASSQVSSDPGVRAQAAADQLPGTTWIASPLDDRPTLTLDLPGRQRVSGLVLQTAPDAPASRPLEVALRINGLTATHYLDDEGTLRFPGVQTDSIQITFGVVNPVRSVSSASGASRQLPVGITELQVLGGPDRRMRTDPSATVSVPCGFGPSVIVDGAATLTNVMGTVGGILAGSLAGGQSCGGAVRLGTGEHRIRVEPSAEWLVERVYLIPEQVPIPATFPGRARVVSWSSVDRLVDFDPAGFPRLLELTENHNEGWTASIGQIQLQPFRVDGWRQAFLVPADLGGPVRITYPPDSMYRTGLLLGLVAIVLLGLLVVVPRRWASLPPPAGPASRTAVAVTAPLGASLLVGSLLGIVAAGALLVAGISTERRHSTGRALRSVRSAGSAGLVLALSAQVLWPWPGRHSVGIWYDLLVVTGPALALGALAFVAIVASRAPSQGRASRELAN